MDADVKHPSVQIYLVTTVYQILQSAYFVCRSVADSGQVGRKMMCLIVMTRHVVATAWHVPSTLQQAVWCDGATPLSSVPTNDVTTAAAV